MTSRNTIRTLIQYFASIWSKYTGLGQAAGGAELSDIFNYVAISDQIGSSGQPTPEQFRSISEAGFEQIINLLPGNSENSLDNEAEIVAELGMDYVYIPVDFRGPKESDFGQFVAAMEGHNNRKVWVHCAVNARVSVFVARYRRDVMGIPKEEAHAPIGQVWEPFGVWKKFITG